MQRSLFSKWETRHRLDLIVHDFFSTHTPLPLTGNCQHFIAAQTQRFPRSYLRAKAAPTRFEINAAARRSGPFRDRRPGGRVLGASGSTDCERGPGPTAMTRASRPPPTACSASGHETTQEQRRIRLTGSSCSRPSL